MSLPNAIRCLCLICLVSLLTMGSAVVADEQDQQLATLFDNEVKGFLATHCNSCHGSESPEGDLDLSLFTSVGRVVEDHKRWELVLDRLTVGDMPPSDADSQPSSEQRQKMIQWIKDLRAHEGEKNAGDPGPTPVRRLSNAEYNYTIRDLTGVDIRPTKEFPVDAANEAGFDNSADSLSTSPALVKKYLDAARFVADHLALTPDGFVFAPHPVIAHTDRDKFCVNRIVGFYQQQPTKFADYFYAAWKLRNDAADENLRRLAASQKLSEKYLKTVHRVLTETNETIGPIAALQTLWKAIPENASEADAKAACEQMEAFAVDLRGKLVPVVNNLKSPRVNDGSQPLVIWKNQQMATNHTRYTQGMALAVKDWKLPAESVARQMMAIPESEEGKGIYEKTFEKFCALFPDKFYISERGRVFENEESRGRLLSAGFHNQQGYFRDDQALSDLILDDVSQKQLDQLWHEFDLIADSPQRQYRSFIWYERAESSFMRDEIFHSFRSEDKDSISDEQIRKLQQVYLEKAIRSGAGETAQLAMNDYFQHMNTTFRMLEKAHVDYEQNHLPALHDFAAKAFRRPLTDGEKQNLSSFYRALRSEEGLTHEDAIRDCVVGVLMSPRFFFRLGSLTQSAQGIVPLSDHALANRLSYFLWASMPDDELLTLASVGNLHQPDVLKKQVRRMLKDPRARGLAVEFAGNWLDFRRFEEHNAVDRTRFLTFDNDLRQAMFEEPVRFFQHVAAGDGKVLDFLYGDYTFLNQPLAKHYGITLSDSRNSGDGWYRVENVSANGRGGLLPMSVFLTKNAPGLRTSPVKRGYWVAKRLLGEHIPPPPPDVPELPADESTSELPLRQALAKHREIQSCASCHARFDSLGLVFEGYGPVGERRSEDLGGRPVDANAQFPNGVEGSGLDGLTMYIRENRQNDFVDNLDRKLLAYALGRTLLLSDEKLLREMHSNLVASDYQFAAIVETIVTSPQFLNQRGSTAAK